MSLIQVHQLDVVLGRCPVVQGVSLEVRPGEVIGLIGPNGAGKSTLVKALAGILPAHAGDIRLEDRPFSQWRAAERARMTGYLPQGAHIHWPLSVERTVALGRIPHQSPWQPLSDADRQAVREALEATDTAALAARRVDALAGGEKTLVMIARVLAGEPRVILADEPVAGLDPYHQLQVMELLRSRAQQGCGILVVLHDLSLAARFCHRLYFMKTGRFLAAGAPAEVLTPEHLREGYSIEAELLSGQTGLHVLARRRL